ncbi:MAG: transposase, partial [Verrucomicrobiota bacterium]
AEVRITRHNLPHWDQQGATYFVTFRLGDSLPGTLLAQWKSERDDWLKTHAAPISPVDEREYHRLFSVRIDEWLDAGHGACVLREPRARACVAESLHHFDHVRYRLVSWVVMPNHVHVCLTVHPAWRLEQMVFTWKRRMAGEINRITGNAGPVWQRDYFDRLVRNPEHFNRVLSYIRRNPETAKLRDDEYTLWEAD